MAIKLRAVKAGMTTGEVVQKAVGQLLVKELEEAKKALAEQAS